MLPKSIISFCSKLKHYRRNSLIRKVKKYKEKNALQGISYKDYPKLSFIIQFFNHRANIKPIIERLRLTQADEIIVCEDGSIDGSRQEWMKYLNHPNDFLIHSNDIHEIRAYNRAINIARGKITCCLQDDDIPPGNGEWVEQALKLFGKYSKLAILGGYRGLEYDLDVNRKCKYGYQNPSKSVKEIPFLEPQLKIPFMFAQSVKIGPIFYRKDAWLQIGGFDLNYSKPGEPGIVFDEEICFRAWLSGWQVGLYGPLPFKRYVGGSGTEMFCNSLRIMNRKRNLELIRMTFGDKFKSIIKYAKESNEALQRRII